MSKFDITASIFYRWRYWIGYGLILTLLVGLLLMAAFVVPAGLTENEQRAIVTTSQLDPSTMWHTTPLNAPFYLLQYLSIELFGLTELGIKLPALLLGLITAVCMIFLLRRWFAPGIAVLAAVLAVTTGQFLFLAQQGSPSILYLFWPTLLLLLATLVANRVRHHAIWKILLFVFAALSLYTPLSIYVLLSLGSAIIIHPHLRYIIKRLPRIRIIISSVIALILLVPLIASIAREPTLSLRLLGIPQEWPALIENLQALASQYLGFMSLGSSSILMPVFSFASMLIITYGLLRLIRSRQTVQSHVVLAWTILLLPVLIINPAFTSIMFVPLFLLLATGLEDILRRWYRLFPRNPYARVAGLIPLIVLVGSMVLFGFDRYVHAYRYSPDTMRNFSQDILIIPDQTKTLVVTESERDLYEAVASHRSDLQITTQQPDTGPYTVTAAAYDGSVVPSSVITTSRSQEAARFYLYD